LIHNAALASGTFFVSRINPLGSKSSINEQHQRPAPPLMHFSSSSRTIPTHFYPYFIIHKLAVYNPGGYRGIPCVILLVDGIVTYVGSPQENFRPILEQTLAFLEAEALREE
jgi:hypothetical protein